MCVYGYCRISTKQQSIERQIRNIKAEFPNAVIFKEAFTGTKLDRPEWNKLYKKVKSGDTLVFDSVSRMSRNAEEGIKTYFELFDRGVTLVFLKEAYINTDTYADSLKDKIELTGTDEDEIFKGLNNYFRKLAERQIRIAFEQAQKEVDDLHQRTREGIETARINGKQIGQQKGRKLTTKKSIEAKKQIKKYSKSFSGTLLDNDVMKLTGLSRNTFYKYKRELTNEEEMNMEKMRSNLNDTLYSGRGDWIELFIEDHIDEYMEDNKLTRKKAEKELKKYAEEAWEEYYEQQISELDDSLTQEN